MVNGKIPTILFGGAFDPVHKGHLYVANEVLNRMKKIDPDTELWFLPTNSGAYGGKDMQPFEVRYGMLREAVAHAAVVRGQSVSDFEYRINNKAGTYAVVKELQWEYPDREFYFILGKDQAVNFRSWRNSRKLLKMVKFIVVPRRRNMQDITSPLPLWVNGNPHKYMLLQSAPYAGANSTKIREFIAGRYKGQWTQRSDYLDKNLTPPVIELIEKHQLYKEK